MSDTQQENIWYRQPLVWMIIAIPLSAVIAGMHMLYLAVTTDDGLVADDYYKQGLAINKRMAKEDLALELLLGAAIDIDRVTGSVQLDFDKGKLVNLPEQLHLSLLHATNQHHDRIVILDSLGEGVYRGKIEPGLPKAYWYVQLRGDAQEESWLLTRRIRSDSVTSFTTELGAAIQ